MEADFAARLAGAAMSSRMASKKGLDGVVVTFEAAFQVGEFPRQDLVAPSVPRSLTTDIRVSGSPATR